MRLPESLGLDKCFISTNYLMLEVNTNYLTDVYLKEEKDQFSRSFSITCIDIVSSNYLKPPGDQQRLAY